MAIVPAVSPAGLKTPPLKTVVYQSFRTTRVPFWIEAGMGSVKAWALSRGYDYRFIDDALFDYVPGWYRKKANDDVLLISDLARLELAKEFLAGAYERTVWIDADVVVFDPDRFEIEVTEGFAFCQELWMQKYRWLWFLYDAVKKRKFAPYFVNRNVANFVTVFTRGTAFLDFYIEACREIVKFREPLSRWDVGTRFLTTLHSQLPFPLLTNVSLFSPFLLHAIETRKADALACFMKLWGKPIYAANLCSSKANETYESIVVTEKLFHNVMETLSRTRGAILNEWVPVAVPADPCFEPAKP